jgi:hypothetical protein
MVTWGLVIFITVEKDTSPTQPFCLLGRDDALTHTYPKPLLDGGARVLGEVRLHLAQVEWSALLFDVPLVQKVRLGWIAHGPLQVSLGAVVMDVGFLENFPIVCQPVSLLTSTHYTWIFSIKSPWRHPVPACCTILELTAGASHCSAATLQYSRGTALAVGARQGQKYNGVLVHLLLNRKLGQEDLVGGLGRDDRLLVDGLLDTHPPGNEFSTRSTADVHDAWAPSVHTLG